MLAQLKIENVAVIEKAEVRFTEGLNVLTGETGAGKSILIDSINAILGNRTSRELVRSGAQKACIWATFEQIPASVHKQLEKFGYEDADDLLLYREINAEGKGSCRVNGMPATAAVVRDISAGFSPDAGPLPLYPTDALISFRSGRSDAQEQRTA